jgi:transporter family-2 protein
MKLLPIILAVLAGIFTTIETSINAQLGKHITPGIATLHSLIVGMLLMLLISLYNGRIGLYAKITSVKPIWLIGGIFGALIIYFSSRSIPEIGISNTLILILSGQLLSGLVIDVIYNDMVIGTRKIIGLFLFLIGTIMFLKE